MAAEEKYKARKNKAEDSVEDSVPKTQDEINAENNANTIKNAAEVASNSANPYAKAIGTAVKMADKYSGGKATQKLGEKMNKINKIAPGGRTIQKASNKLSESGTGDKIGQAAAAKNGSNASSGSGSSNSSSSSSSGNYIDTSGGLKIIALGMIATFLPLILFITVFAQQDEVNMGATNNTQMSTSGNFNGVVDSATINGGNATMLANGETLLSRLGEAKLNEINEQIKSDVIKAGSGTGAGVATAAYDFIKLLLDNGINMTYVYGGEHGVVKEGLYGSWGSGSGLDCSAFVSWAMYNGGCKNNTHAVVSGTQATYGVETTTEGLKAGDIVANSEHVMLILSNNGSSVVVAHASSPTNGIIFSEIGYDGLSKYSLRDMTSYYQQNCSS